MQSLEKVRSWALAPRIVAQAQLQTLLVPRQSLGTSSKFNVKKWAIIILGYGGGN